MTTSRFSLATLLISAPIAMLLITSSSACVLNDEFIKEAGQFGCTQSSDCSEPGQICQDNGFCGFDVTTKCDDKDGDGYGVNEDDRSRCKFPQVDLDDDCAACTPVARETCDGFDNDSNKMVDEPISCAGSITDCPLSAVIPAGSQWSCKSNQCVLIPQLSATPECKNVTLPCVDGSYDNTQAIANGCITP
jgi:hypothetical protein